MRDYPDRIYLGDLAALPVGTILDVGGILYEKVTIAGQTMPSRDFYEDWQMLTPQRGSALPNMDRALIRGFKVKVLTSVPVNRATLKEFTND